MEMITLPKTHRSKIFLLYILFVTPCLAFAQSNQNYQTIPDTVLIKVEENNGDFTFNLYETDDCNAALPSISFIGMLSKLTPAAQSILASIAASIKDHPSCKVKVSGHGSNSKRTQQLSWDRVNAVIKYLVERQGISEERFIFEYGQDGDVKVVDLAFSNENGPVTVPAPHPQYQPIPTTPAPTTVKSSPKINIIALRIIKITGGDPRTEKLTLDYPQKKAHKKNKIIWYITTSEVDSIVGIESKPGQTDIWVTPPALKGKHWEGEIKSNAPDDYDYYYTIIWKATSNGPKLKHDPIIAIRPNAEILPPETFRQVKFLGL